MRYLFFRSPWESFPGRAGHKQLHMKPTTSEYMTEWDWQSLAYSNDGVFIAKAAHQGKYWQELSVTDENGQKSTYW